MDDDSAEQRKHAANEDKVIATKLTNDIHGRLVDSRDEMRHVQRYQHRQIGAISPVATAYIF